MKWNIFQNLRNQRKPCLPYDLKTVVSTIYFFILKTVDLDIVCNLYELYFVILQLKLLFIFSYRDEMEISSKMCYVKFGDKASCDVAQHLTNTVFIDRPLVVVPLTDGRFIYMTFSFCMTLTLTLTSLSKEGLYVLWVFKMFWS